MPPSLDINRKLLAMVTSASSSLDRKREGKAKTDTLRKKVLGNFAPKRMLEIDGYSNSLAWKCGLRPGDQLDRLS
jgi:hypothetical protein